MKILVIHGPNLPFIGKISATTGTRLTLDKIDTKLRRLAREKNFELKIYQLYSEEKIVKTIARARQEIAGILIAPGALALNCPVLVELLAILGLPLVEVHLSEMPHATEVFQQSQLKLIAKERVLAAGGDAYEKGVKALLSLLKIS